MKAFFAKTSPPEAIIQELVSLSHIARKEGLLKLEKQPVDDPFLKKAIMYCVDGHEPEFIQEVLDKEIELTIERHGQGRGIFTAVGDAAPAFGMIGTLIGLVGMLGNMKDPNSIGPAMAVALLTTLYGAIMANLVALPIADKLKRRSQEEELNKRLVVEGVLGLQKGLNPRVLEELLSTFLPPKKRAAEE
jgi:chemotaxis protein MotA